MCLTETLHRYCRYDSEMLMPTCEHSCEFRCFERDVTGKAPLTGCVWTTIIHHPMNRRRVVILSQHDISNWKIYKTSPSSPLASKLWSNQVFVLLAPPKVLVYSTKSLPWFEAIGDLPIWMVMTGLCRLGLKQASMRTTRVYTCSSRRGFFPLNGSNDVWLI